MRRAPNEALLRLPVETRIAVLVASKRLVTFQIKAGEKSTKNKTNACASRRKYAAAYVAQPPPTPPTRCTYIITVTHNQQPSPYYYQVHPFGGEGTSKNCTVFLLLQSCTGFRLRLCYILTARNILVLDWCELCWF